MDIQSEIHADVGFHIEFAVSQLVGEIDGCSQASQTFLNAIVGSSLVDQLTTKLQEQGDSLPGDVVSEKHTGIEALVGHTFIFLEKREAHAGIEQGIVIGNGLCLQSAVQRGKDCQN